MRPSLPIRSPWLWPGVIVVCIVALAPWWRNRAFLRDFYDYGLVMAGVGRIAAGERPYVDFTTPIQTGTFLVNGWAERLGGGTFQAMTLGCAFLIVAATIVLSAMLATRWPFWAAGTAAVAIVVGSLAQHTIIWHNGLGVICLAVAACASALAPVWRRKDLPWNVLTAFALFAGGLNKLNFHLVTIVVVLCWLWRARIARAASWRELLAGHAHVAAWGIVMPVAFETLWTGASPSIWWNNVVALAAGGRAEYLRNLGDPQTYLRPLHDYYGDLAVPWVGAAGLIMTVIVASVGVATTWRRGSRFDAMLVVVAATGLAAASLALLVTNHEIAYVSLAAWIALLGSVWLGFGLPQRGAALGGCLILPALLLGAVFWQSAWEGQRSQFGHSSKPRSEYVFAETAGGEFAYLSGTRVPQEFVLSMAAAREWRARLAPDAGLRVFHGPGLEFLDRIWHSPRTSGQPLWMHVGTSYRPEQASQLARSLLAGGQYDHVIVPIAHEEWPAAVRAALHGGYGARERSLGPVWRVYDRLRAPSSLPESAFAFMGAFQGNVHVNMFSADNLEAYPSSDDRPFLGVERGSGALHVRQPSYRFSAEMVVSRPPSVPSSSSWKARFEVVRDPDGASRYVMLSRELELAPGVAQRVEPFAVDGIGLKLDLVVTVLSEPEAGFAAGWRAFRLSHAFDGPDSPERFSSRSADPVALDEAALQSLLPEGWRPLKAFSRGGRLTPHGFELPPHGELWLWHEQVVSELTGGFSVAPGVPWTAQPLLKVLGYKGGRVEITSQAYMDPEERSLGFRTWSPEVGSWLVILADTNEHAPPVIVRLHHAAMAE